ncbi:hypothetical protein [Phytohabitans rumicis]|uniref:hypothetical protein n=1 Tax=Phytohabitans rumicis TaxID=1076125 RepID=UPI001C49BA8C|nr:hypothetical protein [Phytohabitans rumicis]
MDRHHLGSQLVDSLGQRVERTRTFKKIREILANCRELGPGRVTIGFLPGVLGQTSYVVEPPGQILIRDTDPFNGRPVSCAARNRRGDLHFNVRHAGLLTRPRKA